MIVAGNTGKRCFSRDPRRALLVLCVELLWVLPLAPALANETAEHIAAGTKWQTPVYVIDANRPGPTVMIVGGVHGNEVAGANAAEAIRHWHITRGRLVVLPRANVPALAANRRCDPNEPDATRDLNRNFPVKPSRDRPRGQLAEAIWRLTERTRPDWLIDLHEGINYRKVSTSTGASVIRTDSPEVVRIAGIMLDAVNATIDDPNHRFVPLMGPVKGSLARAAWQRLGAKAMILETCRKDKMALRVGRHGQMVRLLLEDLKMVGNGGKSPGSHRKTTGRREQKKGRRGKSPARAGEKG